MDPGQNPPGMRLHILVIRIQMVSLLFVEKFSKDFDYCFSANFPNKSMDRIERFHSRDQRAYLLNETKESFCITKELNSHRTDLVHQYGRHDVT